MRSFVSSAVSLFSLFSTLAAMPAMPQDKPMLGFTTEHSTQQRSLETKFDAVLNRNNLRDWMKRLTAHPHHIGSPYGKQNAEFIAAQFRSWGYDTQIEQFDVLFPTPRTRVMEMTAPVPFQARLQEPTLKEDATSSLVSEQLPTYNAYSIDGDVTAPLVYVNYGVPRDYEVLEARGIDVKGKIVIARYGGAWRGIKPKVAAEHGAVGCLIYSDPRDDGYFQGDVYPKGSFRMDQGVQRGSVADMPVYPGDPLTPGIGAVKGAPRLALKDAATLTKIPVMPISYADALPLLQALTGPVAPTEWRGALPFTYHIGPGPSIVHLKLAFDWKTVPAYDVIAKLPGSERPDEWVIRGNHQDAWVCGAEDPISGAVALMEEARAVGVLAASGWRPKRTIVYATWDGEEPGLLGSTEWVETHADLLTKNAVAYINSDSNGRGYLGMEGSHTLQKFVNEVGREVIDPEKKIPALERERANEIVGGNKEVRGSGDLPIGALGSGSDFSPFLQHLGIASVNLGYGGENPGGSYHSIFDSFDFYVRYGDPHFDYGVALAETAGRMVLRMADADVLPFEFNSFADTVDKYVKEVTQLVETMRAETEETNRQLTDGTLQATFDPTETHIAPKPKAAVPYLNFAPLQNAMAKLRDSVKAYETAAKSASPTALTAERQKALDTILMGTERALLHNEGLPRRPWYKHYIYAPGLYTGYGVKTLPGVREAIEQRNWKEAGEQITITADVLSRFASELDHATATLH